MSKGLYILPSLFTTANIAFGYYAILQITHGTSVDAWHYDNAAKAIGFAVLFDGLDGRIARMTGTSSDFGKELDSLADVITFGVAPALLAWMWGFRQLPTNLGDLYNKLLQFGAIASFLFLMAGASRLARFNITSNPAALESRTPGQEIFCRHADSGGRGSHCRRGHFSVGDPITSWWTAITWMLMVVAVGYLMVSTWRFYSFKDIDFRSRQPFQLVILFGLLFAAIRFYSQWVLFLIALLYVFSGVFWRLKWIFRRKGSPPPPPAYTEASQTFMSSNFKSVPTTHADPVRAGDLYRLAIVGAGTLKGKEIAEVLGDRNFPSSDIKLLDDNDSLGQLEVGRRRSFVHPERAIGAVR